MMKSACGNISLLTKNRPKLFQLCNMETGKKMVEIGKVSVTGGQYLQSVEYWRILTPTFKLQSWLRCPVQVTLSLSLGKYA